MSALIKDNIARGATVHSDGWAAYASIDWKQLGMKHERHVHQPSPNLMIRTFMHSNYIEGVWGEIKYIMKHMYSTISGTESLDNYLYEALWRREFKMLPEDQ